MGWWPSSRNGEGLYQPHSQIGQCPVGHRVPAACQIGEDIPVAPLPEYQVVIEVFGGDAIEAPHKPLQLRMKRIDVLDVIRRALVRPDTNALVCQSGLGSEAVICPVSISHQYTVRGNGVGKIAIKVFLGQVAETYRLHPIVLVAINCRQNTNLLFGSAALIDLPAALVRFPGQALLLSLEGQRGIGFVGFNDTTKVRPCNFL